MPIALKITTNVHVQKSFIRIQIRHFILNALLKITNLWTFSWQTHTHRVRVREGERNGKVQRTVWIKSQAFGIERLQFSRTKLIVTDIEQGEQSFNAKSFHTTTAVLSPHLCTHTNKHKMPQWSRSHDSKRSLSRWICLFWIFNTDNEQWQKNSFKCFVLNALSGEVQMNIWTVF